VLRCPFANQFVVLSGDALSGPTRARVHPRAGTKPGRGGFLQGRHGVPLARVPPVLHRNRQPERAPRGLHVTSRHWGRVTQQARKSSGRSQSARTLFVFWFAITIAPSRAFCSRHRYKATRGIRIVESLPPACHGPARWPRAFARFANWRGRKINMRGTRRASVPKGSLPKAALPCRCATLYVIAWWRAMRRTFASPPEDTRRE
jgi:hypothetical protein